MRSRYTRRSRVRLSASPTGFSPLVLYSVAMNASIGFDESVTPAGTSGRRTGARYHGVSALSVSVVGDADRLWDAGRAMQRNRRTREDATRRVADTSSTLQEAESSLSKSLLAPNTRVNGSARWALFRRFGPRAGLHEVWKRRGAGGSRRESSNCRAGSPGARLGTDARPGDQSRTGSSTFAAEPGRGRRPYGMARGPRARSRREKPSRNTTQVAAP